jgi:hypothetical protein
LAREPGFRASIDARCFLVRMGTTGKLNDYNEFSGNRSRQRALRLADWKSSGLFLVGNFKNPEALEIWIGVQFRDRDDQFKMHVLKALFAAWEDLTSEQYSFMAGPVFGVKDVVEPGFRDLVSHAKEGWGLFAHKLTAFCSTGFH